MRGVKLEDLLAIIEFLYCGEANVCQEDLELFLGIAEELQLPGLKRTSHNGDVIEAKKEVLSPQKEKKVKKKEKRATITGSDPLKASEEYQIEKSGKDMVAEGNLSLSNNFSGDVKDLDEKCKTLMEKTSDKRENGNAIYMCKVCGKGRSAVLSRITLKPSIWREFRFHATFATRYSGSYNFTECIFITIALKTYIKIQHIYVKLFRNRRSLKHHATREHQ